MTTGAGEPVVWRLCRFDELDAIELHDLLRLRIEVFVVEQACAYAEIDGLDPLTGTRHLVGRRDGRVIACARSLVPDAGVPESSRIGRVVVAVGARGQGHARTMLRQLVEDLERRCPERTIELAAQTAAEQLYAASGFARTGEPYLEDGIEHVDMRRDAVSPPVL